MQARWLTYKRYFTKTKHITNRQQVGCIKFVVEFFLFLNTLTYLWPKLIILALILSSIVSLRARNAVLYSLFLRLLNSLRKFVLFSFETSITFGVLIIPYGKIVILCAYRYYLSLGSRITFGSCIIFGSITYFHSVRVSHSWCEFKFFLKWTTWQQWVGWCPMIPLSLSR